MVKFADDTYIIIPAVNANSRQSELINVESWSRVNNFRVNPTKYAEIIFMDKRRKTTVQLPQPMQNVARVSVIKILEITFTNHLSVAENVQTVINSSAQTLYALRTLRAHGMDDATLQTVFRSVVIAKLTTPQARGGVSQPPQTGNDSRHSFEEVIVVDLYHQASHL